MYSVPPGFSSLRLPLGDFVIYPTERPSIRILVRQIEDYLGVLGPDLSVP